MSAAWAKTTLLTAAALLSPACEGNLEAVRKEETRYQQEFPGRELPVVALETLEGARQLVPSSRERAYALDGRVGVEGDYYIFTVFTPHGSYTVKGAFALAEACREARIVEMFLCSPYSVRMQKAMGDFWSPAKGPRGTMFVSPVDSIRGLGRSFHFQFQEWENNYASASKNDSRALDGINRAGFNAGAAERVFAYHLRADAYSENPAFQALLRALASDREMADALLPAPRRFFVPCGGLNGLTPEDYVPLGATVGRRRAARAPRRSGSCATKAAPVCPGSCGSSTSTILARRSRAGRPCGGCSPTILTARASKPTSLGT